MTIDERGNVVWTRESDDHRLYYVNNNGVWSDDGEGKQPYLKDRNQ